MTQPSDKQPNPPKPAVQPKGEITQDPLPAVHPRGGHPVPQHLAAGSGEETPDSPLPVVSADADDGAGSSAPAIIAEEASDSPWVGIDDQPPDDEDQEEHGKVMTVIEHLDELRTRILRGLGSFVVTMALALWAGKDVIVWLEKPAGNMQFQALSLEEPVIVYFKVAFYLAIVMASPFILGEFAGFIWPGLKQREKQVLLPIIVGGPLLFVAGALFAYYLALPPMLFFFNSFGQAVAPIHQRLDFYISLVLSVMLYMGLCFQLPIVLFCLSFAGIVNSRQLLKVWRYAIIVCSMVAAVVTPDPTVISMLIVMVALVSLYFGSVLLLRVFGK